MDTTRLLYAHQSPRHHHGSSSNMPMTITMMIMAIILTLILSSPSHHVAADVINVNDMAGNVTECIIDSLCGTHGTCMEGSTNDTHVCDCDVQWTGDTCSSCADNFYPANNCTKYCKASITCSNQPCAADGSCICDANMLADCSGCLDNYYGTPCTFCNASTTCKGHGSCSLSGNGQCECDTGWAGSQCDTCATNYYGPQCNIYCLASSTCSNKGKCQAGNGTCACDEGFAGAACSSCATDYYVYPTCSRCVASEKCGGRGTCNPVDGKCICSSLYSGVDGCTSCATTNTYGPWPNCVFCEKVVSCNNHGGCNSTGGCDCTAGFTGASCDRCSAGYFGSECQRCPLATDTSQVCSGHGTCSDGKSGSGTCTCNSGWRGAACQYSDATTCSGHGVVSYEGLCSCSTGYAGTSCSSCDSNYFSYPTCTYCTAAGKCNNHGSCNATGDCVCLTGWAQPLCSSCVIDFYAPACTYCTAATSCNSRGYCSLTGSCICNSTSVIGAACDQCQSGYFGTNCQPCPGGATTPCASRGTCSQGISGTGVCSCNSPFWGTSCQNPVLSMVSPSIVTTAGGVTLSLSGYYFGANPIVNISGVICDVFASTDTQIICTLQASQPPLGGNATITVNNTVLGIVSQPLPFYYLGPSVISMTPTTVAAIGGTNITITGANFGLSAMLYVRGVIYPILLQTHTRIIFVSPPGLGTNISVVVSVVGVNATGPLLSYRYGNPVITSITPMNGTTDGGYTVTIQGVNFGTTGLGAATVALPSWGDCTIVTRTDGVITCTLPPGQGLSQVINVTIGPNNQRTSTIFNYNAPNITSVSGCATVESAVSTADCPPTGANQTITILGSNFGVTLTGLKVTVGSSVCASLAFGVPSHRNITCTLPSGYGRRIGVTVTRGVQTSPTRTWLSYQGPQLTMGTLHLSEKLVTLNSAGVATVSVNDTAGGTPVTMSGTFIGEDSSVVAVYYGPSTNPTAYGCTNVRHMYNGSFTCTTSGGVGQGLQFTVVVGGVASNQGADLLSYPAPIITPGTIRFAGKSPATFIVSNTTQGDLIAFDGAYFGTDITQISVTYGLTTLRSCAVTNATTTSTIYCYTQPGQGLALNFTVSVGTVTTAQVAYGSDTYSYALPPIILSVSGCNTSDSVRTWSCPTSGLDDDGDQILLTVMGDKFYGEITSVTVGGQSCLGLQFLTQDSFTCQLPVGAGLDRLVVVDRGLSFSENVPYVSYQEPDITAISGCTYISDDRTGNCDRQGGTWITLQGTNFGASDATVFVGGQECTNVTHDSVMPHSQVTCILPAGVGYGNAVLLFQNGGELTPTALFVDYKPCAPGTYVYPTGSTSCSSCPKGSFAALSAQTVCESCAAGAYSSVTGVTECTQCEQGKYMADTGSQVCSPCTTGRYASSIGSTVCIDCDLGTYARDGSATACTQCAAGQFQNVKGASICSDCAVGYKSSFTGAAACLPCGVGEFAKAAGSTNCTSCPSGTKSISEPRSSCDSCSVGYFSASSGQENCLACPAGKFNKDPAQTACSDCLAGSYNADTAQSICRSCPIGKATASLGQVQCIDCLEGFYAPTEGLQQCQQCEPGRAISTQQATICTACIVGYYQGSYGQQRCLACPSGTYGNRTGLTECDKCPAGTQPKSSGEGQTTCISCTPGTFTGLVGLSSCGPCPAGQSSNAGASVCFNCEPGRYSIAGGNCQSCTNGTFSGAGATICTTCLAGQYASPSFEATVCLDCQAGSYSEVAKSIQCTACPIGRAVGIPGRAQCAECESGSFMNTTGATACRSCPAGTSIAQPGGATITICTACAAGYFSGSTGATVCTACSAGYISGTGQSICTPCARGKVSSYEGKSECTPCAVGSYGSSVGLTVCSSCEAGTYAATTGLEKCTSCETGRYSSIGGASVCSLCRIGTGNPFTQQSVCPDCDAGKISTVEGQVECTPCSAGRYQPNPAKTSCLPCDAGKFTTTTGSSSCYLCSSGSYQNDTAAQSCRACEPGKFGTNTGLTECFDCDRGTFSVSPSSASCTACALGSYNNRTGQELCTPCESGSYGFEATAKSCKVCPVGRFTGQGGQTVCFGCAPGSFTARENSSYCDPCGLGTAQPQSGYSSCTNCTAGRFTSTGSQLECAACGTGKYQPLEGQSDCVDCPVGTFMPDSGASVCRPCDQGTYSGSGQSTCSLCSAGRFTNQTGQSTCSLCLPGEQQPLIQATACTSCDVGRYSQNYETIECTPCPKGHYLNVTGGKSACDACPLGYAQFNEGFSLCEACKVGAKSDVTGSITCTDCSKGTYQDMPGQATCLDCPAGKYQQFGALSFCELCDEGKFSIGGQSQCTLCPSGTAASAKGQSACETCGAYSSSSDDRITCPCYTGYFDNNRDDGASNVSICNQCPRGVDCSQTGTVFATMVTLSGYWRVNNESLDYYVCPIESYCPGGDSCKGHRGGVLCALCLDGYYETADHTCSLCQGEGRDAFTYFVTMSVLFAIAATIIFIGFGYTGRVYLLDDTRAVYKLEEKKRVIRKMKWTRGDHFLEAGTVGAGVLGVTKVTARDFGTGGVEDEADHAAAQLEKTAHLAAMRTAGAGRVLQSPSQAAAEYHREWERIRRTPPAGAASGNDGQMSPLGTLDLHSPSPTSAVASPQSTNRSSLITPLIGGTQSDGMTSPPTSPPVATRSSLIGAVGGNATDMSSPEAAAAAFKALSALADQRRAQAVATAAAQANGSGATGTHDDDDDDEHMLTGGKNKTTVSSPLASPPMSPDGNYHMLSSPLGSPIPGTASAMVLTRDGSQRRLTRAARVAQKRDRPDRVAPGEMIIVPRGAVRRSIGNSVKIVVSFFQISTTLAFNFALPWPTAYRIFLSVFDVLNIDLVAATSASCVTPVSYYVTWAVMLLVPLALAIGLAIVLFLWAQIILRCRTRNLEKKQRLEERAKGKERAFYVFLKLMNFSLFLLYPRLSNAALRLLSCTKVEGVYYLRADFRIVCYESEWVRYALINIVAILAYPIGVPLLVYGLLRWVRRTLTFRHPLARYSLGFIYQGYKAEVWWFELVDMLHKLILTSLLGFFPNAWQLPMCMVSVIAYYLIILFRQPYHKKRDERLHLLAQANLFLLLMAAHIFNNGTDLDGASDLGLSVFLCITTGYLVSLFLFGLTEQIYIWLDNAGAFNVCPGFHRCCCRCWIRDEEAVKKEKKKAAVTRTRGTSMAASALPMPASS